MIHHRLKGEVIREMIASVCVCMCDTCISTCVYSVRFGSVHVWDQCVERVGDVGRKTGFCEDILLSALWKS